MTQIAAFAGRFASQPLVFAHLLDAADQYGLALDLDHVEVIQGPPRKRLGHVMTSEDTEAVIGSCDPDETLVLVFPEALIPGARLFASTPMLRPLGQFAATRSRVL
jgi:hypothetical protein